MTSQKDRSWQSVTFIEVQREVLVLSSQIGKLYNSWDSGCNTQGSNLTLNNGGLVAKSCLSLETPWTVVCQAPLSLGFSRQEYWSGLPCPSPGDLPDPEIKPGSPELKADSLPSEPTGKPLSKHWKWKSLSCVWLFVHPMDYTVHGILQARILEWVAIPISRGSSWPKDQTQVSPIVGGFFTSWATRQAKKYWSG